MSVTTPPPFIAVYHSPTSHRPLCRPVDNGWQPPEGTSVMIYVVAQRTGFGYEVVSWGGFDTNAQPIGQQIAQEYLDSVLTEMSENPECAAAGAFRHPSNGPRLVAVS